MSEMTRFDPAPSRLKYRVERMMLTPLYRLLLRVGLPFALTFGAASWWLSHEENREWIALTYADARAAIQERPEFMVELMAIDGADPAISEDIREIIPLDFPISSFDLDLDAMRRTITGLDAVESASLFVRQGGVLQVNVRKREPVVLWRTEAGLELLDRGGVMTGPVSTRAAFPDLPVIAGSGADAHVNEALRLVAAAAPLRHRLRGLERMGERRWDVVLDRGQRIMLPEEGAVRALERAIAMDQAVDMLARDLVAVDLRLRERPTLRMTQTALEDLWRIRQIEAGDD
ncbi:Cell division protein FtsQ [Roseivivax sp. THAF40]|uniref:cell division protein FtsQ/DivIB n=1 Tax=unclassified Roseivivax TaxID=2639302 RepID=UPI0012678CD1|nr:MULTISPECIES: cell division protein FtsQ/DivIB [unclassified Roseivivax]QFS82013.1 Cell division protein FtsQ [Roseivivax sp. THAF197b]QFT45813.1 Cell division protein FtsQ [Roseivivax sp. THAF40]